MGLTPYEKNVQEMAERMAEETYNKIAGGTILVGYFIPYAKIAIAYAAEMYIYGYMSNCDEDEQEGIDRWMQNAEYEAKERGLITSRENAAGISSKQ